MKASGDYLTQCGEILTAVSRQQGLIDRIADRFAESILCGRMVHLFGSGHSRIMVEEMWPRYGSFPGWNPIVELSLTFHNLATGANGQRQAMFLENVPGFAGRILRNFDIGDEDSALIISSSGTSVVPVEMAEELQEKGVTVVGMVSQEPLLFTGSIRFNILYASHGNRGGGGIAGGTPKGAKRKDAGRVEAAARLANAHGFVSQLPKGYGTQVGERGR